MARPKKEKLDYYPKDTDQLSDRKIRRLLNDYGANGYLIYEYLLQLIYGGKGYFLLVDNNLAFDISDYLPLEIDESLVNRTLTSCIDYGLFDKEKYENYQVLTNENIQKNYNLAYRGKKPLRQEITINTAETQVNAAITPVNATQTLVFDEKQCITATKRNTNDLGASKSQEIEVKNHQEDESTKIVNATKTPINAAETLVNATITPIMDVESAENRGKMPQKKRKENKIKEIKRKGKEKDKKMPPENNDKEFIDFKNKATSGNFKKEATSGDFQKGNRKIVNETVNEKQDETNDNGTMCQEKSSAKKESPPSEHFQKCKTLFLEKSESYYWQDEDTRALKKLLEMLLQSSQQTKAEQSLSESFQFFIEKLPKYWIEKKFTLPNLARNYNEIVNEIKRKHEPKAPPTGRNEKFGRQTIETLTQFARNFGN